MKAFGYGDGEERKMKMKKNEESVERGWRMRGLEREQKLKNENE